METIQTLAFVGGGIVMLIVVALLLLFARIVLVPAVILGAIGAFLGHILDNAVGSGTCFATIGAIVGGLAGVVGGFTTLGGGG